MYFSIFKYIFWKYFYSYLRLLIFFESISICIYICPQKSSNMHLGWHRLIQYRAQKQLQRLIRKLTRCLVLRRTARSVAVWRPVRPESKPLKSQVQRSLYLRRSWMHPQSRIETNIQKRLIGSCQQIWRPQLINGKSWNAIQSRHYTQKTYCVLNTQHLYVFKTWIITVKFILVVFRAG